MKAVKISLFLLAIFISGFLLVNAESGTGAVTVTVNTAPPSSSVACGAASSGTWDTLNNYHVYPDYVYDLGTGTGLTSISYDVYAVPNKFEVLRWSDGVIVASTTSVSPSTSGWLGEATYSGPYGGSLNTPASLWASSFSFTNTERYYILRAYTNTGPLTTDGWSAGIGCPGSSPPSGSLTASDCTINSGQSSCLSSLNWSTSNSVATSSVTTPTNITVATANSGSTSYSVDYGSRDFYLYHNGQLIGGDTANAICNAGSSWNSSTCANIPPVANAGPDQTITLPTSSVTMAGSASDTAPGTVSSTSWTKISGPATFSITTPSSLTTTITGMTTSGTYFFRLTATDNNGATHTDDMQVTVSTVVKTTPTCSVNNSPQTYTGSPIVATLACSTPGTVSNVKYDGTYLASGPTNAATYAVNLDFVPTDTTNYNSLTNAAATPTGNFVINKATPTASLTNSPTTYTGSAQTAIASCLGGGTATIASGGTGTNVGSYATTVNCAASTNYAATSGLNPGSFSITAASQTAAFSDTSNATYTGSQILRAITCSGGGTPSPASAGGTAVGTYSGSGITCSAIGNYAATSSLTTTNSFSIVAAMSGSLTASSTCFIPEDENSCSGLPFTWSITNKQGPTSDITLDGGGVVAGGLSGNSGTANLSVPVLSYGSARTFRLYNNALELATRSVTPTCGGTTNWDGTKCVNVSTTGNITYTTFNNCTISRNANSCNLGFTWSTTNPVGTSTVTLNGVTVATANSANGYALEVPYNTGTFRLMNNGNQLSSVTVSSSCDTTDGWNGSSCVIMTGTLSTPNCPMNAGESSCNVQVSWSTTNPHLSTSAVTTPTNVTVGTGLSGNVNYNMAYGLSRAFYLYNNGVQLAGTTAQAVCIGGTQWSIADGSCQPTQAQQGTPVLNGCNGQTYYAANGATVITTGVLLYFDIGMLSPYNLSTVSNQWGDGYRMNGNVVGDAAMVVC